MSTRLLQPGVVLLFQTVLLIELKTVNQLIPVCVCLCVMGNNYI